MPGRSDDRPMPLGAHLGELRRLLLWPAVGFGLCFIVAFTVLPYLKVLYAWPLGRALQLVAQWSPEAAARTGMPMAVDPWRMDGLRVFAVYGIEETAFNAVHICLMAASVVAVPLFLWGLWRFVAVGLNDRERALGFLVLPMGVVFFYTGVVLGYTMGVPYLMAFFIDWTVTDPTVATFSVRLSEYQATFATYVVVCGLLLDLPWLIMVLARTGIVPAATMARYRKPALLITAVVAAIVAPPDVFSMLVLMVPIYGLFEFGIVCGRLLEWEARRAAARAENDVGTDG
jgi:sec-independent protein translocase protein TatC